jgi:hypothetical protein
MKVLISTGFGAGWSTWNDREVAKYMRTYKPIIEAIEMGNRMYEEHPLVLQLQKECKEKFGKDYVCVLGAEDLIVVEVTPPFKIHEYDGKESIDLPQDDDWITE